MLIDASYNPDVRTDLFGSPVGNRLALYDLYTGIYQQGHSTDRISAAALEANPAFQRMKMQRKFQIGEINYTTDELPHLEAWLREAGADKVEKLFLEHFLPNSIIYDLETLQTRYAHSSLAKIFSKIKNEP
jgi:hypothetical protein